MPRGVVHETSMRATSAAAALIEEHDTILLRIEEATHVLLGASTGAAVKEQRWLSSRVPALLEVNAVVRIGAKVTGSVWLDGWVQDLCEAHSYSSMTVVDALKKAYFYKCSNQQARHLPSPTPDRLSLGRAAPDADRI